MQLTAASVFQTVAPLYYARIRQSIIRFKLVFLTNLLINKMFIWSSVKTNFKQNVSSNEKCSYFKWIKGNQLRWFHHTWKQSTSAHLNWLILKCFQKFHFRINQIKEHALTVQFLSPKNCPFLSFWAKWIIFNESVKMKLGEVLHILIEAANVTDLT